jgi:hypothetical protein
MMHCCSSTCTYAMKSMLYIIRNIVRVLVNELGHKTQ